MLTGRGRLQERGSGRATTAETDSRGYARAPYTPLSANSTVEAEVRGVRQTVTFTITTGGSPATGPRDTDGPTGTGPISPDVLVGAANRPGMLWVDEGAILCARAVRCPKIRPECG